MKTLLQKIKSRIQEAEDCGYTSIRMFVPNAGWEMVGLSKESGVKVDYVGPMSRIRIGGWKILTSMDDRSLLTATKETV